MRKVYAVGESLLDVIYKNDEIIAQKAGGSMLNTAISLSRLGIPTSLISELGEDESGKMIASFLDLNGVDQSYVARFFDGMTPRAKAILDENNNAHYIFEKIYPKHRLQIDIPNFCSNDILLFGSSYSLDLEIEFIIQLIISKANKANALSFYDPNIRRSIINTDLKERVLRNIAQAEVIRASDEDIKTIFSINTFEKACICIPDLNSKIFIYTCADSGVYLSTPLHKTFFETPKIEPISTIGAGDSFNAGLIHAFHIYNVDSSNLLGINKEVWRKIINHAIRFATEVCQHFDNYISDEFAKEVLSDIRFQ